VYSVEADKKSGKFSKAGNSAKLEKYEIQQKWKFNNSTKVEINNSAEVEIQQKKGKTGNSTNQDLSQNSKTGIL